MKKKVLATAALAATLAFGTAVPAFADAGATDDKSFTKSQTTTVSIETNTDQLSASIPIKMTVVAPAGGGDITAPGSDVYKITNNSLIPIYVTSLKGAEVADSGWKLVSTISDTVAGTVGDIQMSVNDKQITATGTTDVTGDAMKINAKAEGVDNTLGLTVVGKTTPVKSTSDKAVEAIKITYTIAATAATA